MEYLLIVAYAAAIYTGLWGVNAILAIRNSIFQEGYSFDFKYFFSGLLRAAVLVIAMSFGAVLLVQIPTLFGLLGISIDEDLASTISIVAIGTAFAQGVITQAKKFVSNIGDTIEKDDVKITLQKTHDFPSGGLIPLVEDNRDVSTKDEA